ncbi:MAG: glycosyltransferase family 4 protein [Steroidobacteraceae bacterium]
MEVVAYLINRYPEASLTTLRREIEAVESAGIRILRFAHRPSLQPFAAEKDRLEAKLTEYLVTGNCLDLAVPLARMLVRHPVRLARTIRLMLSLGRANLRHVAYLALACRLLERLEAGQAEHLHVHFAQSSAVVAMLAHSLGGPPWTMTVHGPEDFEPSRMRSLHVLAASSNATIAISRWASDATRRVVEPRAADVRVVRMGVDDQFLGPPVPVSASGAIVCIARLDRRKGHSVLFAAVQALRASGQTPHIELIGDGPCRQELQIEAERRGLAGQVTFSGWLTQEGVRDRLDRCRFVVLPSLAEGLPVSIMEAFARARPVVATGVGGITELVRHMENGMVATPGDAAGLADAMKTLLTMSPAALLELGMRGRSTVMEQFDSRANAGTLISIWRDLHR